MTTTSRQVIVGQTINLEIDVRDADGNYIDADSLPQVSITDSRNSIVHSLSSTGVIRIAAGRYRYSYTIPSTNRTGTWIDHWEVTINDVLSEADLNFTVLDADNAVKESEAQIGDDPITTYTQEEIIGINILLASLKARLKNDQKVETTDEYGNIEYIDCYIFTNDELVWFLNSSLQEFNEFPHFTNFLFSDEVIYNRYCYVIVEGAYILALGAQMLIEGGKEWTINDNGVQFVPPQLSNILNNQLSQFLTAHRDLVKNIKYSIKPSPIGFGSFRVLASNPAWSRLRHLRERRII